MSVDRRQVMWAATFWLLLLGGLVALVVNGVWVIHRGADEQLKTLEPRMARLMGLGNDKARLADTTKDVQRQIERHAYPASREATQAGNDAQQRARELFTRAGLEVATIQVLPARQAGAFDRIPIALRLDGELAALQAVLATLPMSAPTIFVEGFSLQGANGADLASPRVMAELQLFVLRARP